MGRSQPVACDVGARMALPSLGSPLFPGLLSLPRFPIPPLGPHPSSGSPWHPHSLWISSQGLHPSLKSLSFLGSLPGLSISPWAPHPSLRPLSLPRVPTPPQYPCPSPGSPSLPVVCILPRHPCPSPESPSLPSVPVPPQRPRPSAGSLHLGEQQERAAGARVSVLLPETEELRGEDGGGKEAEEEKPTDGEVPHLLTGDGNSSGLGPVAPAACGPPSLAPLPAPPHAAQRGTAPPPACGAA